MDDAAQPDPGNRPQPEGAAARIQFLARIERHLWRRIVSGFLVVVPLGVTFLIFRFVVTYLDDILRPRFENTPLDFPGIGLVVIVIALYMIGAIVSARLGRKAFDVQHAVLTMERQVNRVVFVEWPRPGYRAIGFVTGYMSGAGGEGSDWVIVYVPTVPNPTSGNLAFVSENDVIDTDITVEEAMKTVFSGGIIPPPGNLD